MLPPLLKGMPKGMMTYALPPSMGVEMSNPRFESLSKSDFSAPQKHKLYQPPDEFTKWEGKSHNFSYSYPCMYEDTRINSLEIKEARLQRALKQARERHAKLEGIRLAYEEKKRIRRELRLKRRNDRLLFEQGVVTLQSAYRGVRDRENFREKLAEKRQKDYAVTALQSAWRGQQDRKFVSERKHKVVGAAKKIQRKYTTRLRYKEASALLDKLRDERDQRHVRALAAYQEECAVLLQSFVRGLQGRQHVNRIKKKKSKKLKALKKREKSLQRRMSGFTSRGGAKTPSPKRKKKVMKKKKR